MLNDKINHKEVKRENLPFTSFCRYAWKKNILTPTCQKQTTEGFHVTLYQAKFASHHTRDRHVGVLIPQSGLENTRKCPRTFHFYHNTKLQLSDNNISTHAWLEFKILL